MCVYLLGFSFGTKNAYALILSLFGLTALTVLAALGRMQANRFDKAQTEWDTSDAMVARGRESKHQALVAGAKTRAFFRIHFRVRGKLSVGNDAHLHLSNDFSSERGDRIPTPVSFPLSGLFHAAGYLKVQDIFGLTRSRFGETFNRVLTVSPEPFVDTEILPIEVAGGLEDQSNKKSADIERYYMREYVPGDRLRDINWKASSKIAQLITRISPDTQEQTKVLTILFRHFNPTDRETLDSIVHLNYLKSWLLGFMRTVKEGNPNYHFQVMTGRDTHLLKTEEDVDRFAEELSGMFFMRDPGLQINDRRITEFYVFSTPYDRELTATLASYTESKVHIFRTKTSQSKPRENVRDISLYQSLPFSSLPGRWAFTRDSKLRSPAILQQLGRIEEKSLTVTLLGGT